MTTAAASKNSSSTLRGTIKEALALKDGWGRVTLEVTENGKTRSAIAVGPVAALTRGAVATLSGAWKDHPNYGRQFKFDSFTTELPQDAQGLANYLAELLPGVGPHLAGKIIQEFGGYEGAARALSERPDALAVVKGITPARAKAIGAAWAKGAGERDQRVWLAGLGIAGTSLESKLLKKYGADARRRLEAQPYETVISLDRAGFLTADKIARGGLKITLDDPRRARAAVWYILEEAAANDGHLCLPRNVILQKCAHSRPGGEKALGVPEDAAAKAIDHLAERGKLARDGATLEGDPLYWLPYLLQAEEEIVKAAARLIRTFRAPAVPAAALDNLRRPLPSGHCLDESQLAALEMALTSPLCVITGGPGTGKTTITKKLLETFESFPELGVRVIALCAPTGRAARRLREASGLDAMTIHRMLGIGRDGLLPADRGASSSGRDGDDNDHEPNWRDEVQGGQGAEDADFTLCDEMSMTDAPLASLLFQTRADGSRLVLVGDADQLPSVGPGAVLRDLIASGAVPVARLAHIHRQEGGDSAGARISEAAAAINAGRVPEFTTAEDASQLDGGVFFLECPYSGKVGNLRNPLIDEWIASQAVQFITKTLPERFGMDPARDCLALAPQKRGAAGIHELNKRLRLLMNPEAARAGERFQPGDKVIQTVNDYQLDIMNGELGFVLERRGESLIVDFDGEIKSAGGGEALQFAWAMTIHKAQGSECQWAVIPLSMANAHMLSRCLIYTAHTRAKRGVLFCGERKALMAALRDDAARARNGRLPERLKKALAEITAGK